LAWRLRRPGEHYLTLAQFLRDDLQGYVILGRNEINDSHVGKIMDLVVSPDAPGAAADLLDHAIRRLVQDGCEVVWASVFSHSTTLAAYKHAGFFRAPARLLPTELHLGVRAFGDLSPDAVADRSKWYVSLLDSDTH
jgi:hypothetical protein